MEFKEIKELIKLVNESNLTSVSIRQGEFVLKLSKEKEVVTPTVVTASPQVITTPVVTSAMSTETPKAEVKSSAKSAEESTENKDQNLVTFKSPMIGTFYRAPRADAEPFVKVGDTISAGKVLCLIEAMKIFNEIESDVSGKIVKILVDNASPVEYEQPLFLIEPSN